MTVRAYERTADLQAVLALCAAEGWQTFACDPERTHRALSAPGVTTVVATDDDDARVVGFASLHGDGEVQAYLSMIAVDPEFRRRGIGRLLIEDALKRAGGERIDLLTDTAQSFYEHLPHRRMDGYRIYPRASARAASATDALAVRGVDRRDRAWVASLLRERWGATVVISRGRCHDAQSLPGLIAEAGSERVGLATYRVDHGELELVTLDAVWKGHGIGTALLSAVVERARSAGCVRVWLITSNDNLAALRFYQRRNLRLTAIHRDAIERARKLKPQIPRLGDFTIPIHDELELELDLRQAASTPI